MRPTIGVTRWVVVVATVIGIDAAAASRASADPPTPVPTAAPQMNPPPPPAPAPPPTAAPQMNPPPPPPPGPVPVAAPVMAPPPPPPPPAVNPFAVGYSFGLRAGFRLQDPEQPKNMSQVHLDSAYDGPAIEARFHGAVTENFSWVMNFNATVTQAEAAPKFSLGIMDAIAQFKACDAFQIWAGRLLVPSDRANFSGPFFMIPWNYPGFYIANAAPIGPYEGPTGRNNGVTVWGMALDDKLKYYGGAYALDFLQQTQTTASVNNAQVLYSGRVSYNIQGSEPGYFGSSTYYGAKDVVAVGVGAQYIKDGTTNLVTGAPKDYGAVMADVFAEENLGGAGTLTLAGQYYHFPTGYAFSGGLPMGVFSPQNAFYILAAYMTPNNIGIGKIQPMLRLQQTADPAWTAFDAAVAYVIKDYSGRIVLTYQHVDLSSTPGLTPYSNSLQLGIQLQTL
jgi:hypothetical protein